MSLAVTGGLAWWSTAATLAVPRPDDDIDVQLAATQPPAGRAAIDPAAEHWRLPLQQRLFDPPPEPPAPEPTPEPEPPPVRRAPPAWKLLGTIIESRGNTAILETAGPERDLGSNVESQRSGEGVRPGVMKMWAVVPSGMSGHRFVAGAGVRRPDFTLAGEGRVP